MDDFTIKIDDKAISKAFASLARSGKDLTPLMRAEAGHMLHAVEENFLAQGRPRWPGLKPGTIKEREKKGHTPITILRETNALMSSLQTEADKSHAMVGTNNPYAAIHNYGGPIKKKATWGAVYLRTGKNGNLLRNDRGGAIFAGKKHKSYAKRYFNVAAHEITMPKREFMKLTDADLQVMVNEAERYLEKATV